MVTMSRLSTLRLLWLLATSSLAFAQQVLLPAPNGTYTVGRVTTQLTNRNSVQPFAPSQNQAPILELSIFYPTDSKETVQVAYFPTQVASYIDNEITTVYLTDAPNGTFERLVMQLAPEGTPIANSTRPWSLLIFGAAYGTNRNFYNSMISQIASAGYVIVTYDTPYDTDIVLYSDNSTVLANNSIFDNATTLADVIPIYVADNNVRAQDTQYILDQFSDSDFASSLIPGCSNGTCLDANHAGIFGHSIGGAVAATAALNDTRVAGALDFDGTLWGPEVQQGLNVPFMLMVEEGNNRAAFNRSPANSWSQIWPRLRSSKFDLILNNSRHYTFTDYPLVFQLLDILPDNTTVLEDYLLLSDMDGARAHHIVTTYATAFFDWLLKNGTADLIGAVNPLFPEVSLDTDTTSPTNATRGESANRTTVRH